MYCSPVMYSISFVSLLEYSLDRIMNEAYADGLHIQGGPCFFKMNICLRNLDMMILISWHVSWKGSKSYICMFTCISTAISVPRSKKKLNGNFQLQQDEKFASLQFTYDAVLETICSHEWLRL